MLDIINAIFQAATYLIIFIGKAAIVVGYAIFCVKASAFVFPFISLLVLTGHALFYHWANPALIFFGGLMLFWGLTTLIKEPPSESSKTTKERPSSFLIVNFPYGEYAQFATNRHKQIHTFLAAINLLAYLTLLISMWLK